MTESLVFDACFAVIPLSVAAWIAAGYLVVEEVDE